MGGQEALNRGQTESARQERALFGQLMNQCRDCGLRMLLPPLQQRLAGFRTECLAQALVLARLATQLSVRTIIEGAV